MCNRLNEKSPHHYSDKGITSLHRACALGGLRLLAAAELRAGDGSGDSYVETVDSIAFVEIWY